MQSCQNMRYTTSSRTLCAAAADAAAAAAIAEAEKREPRLSLLSFAQRKHEKCGKVALCKFDIIQRKLVASRKHLWNRCSLKAKMLRVTYHQKLLQSLTWTRQHSESAIEKAGGRRYSANKQEYLRAARRGYEEFFSHNKFIGRQLNWTRHRQPSPSTSTPLPFTPKTISQERNSGQSKRQHPTTNGQESTLKS